MANIVLWVRTSLSTCIIKLDSHNKSVRTLLITGSLTDRETRREQTYQLD